ncbi:activating transcription factor 7-interacting protein 2 isoform X2 [Betta splendens]|nr:activating transcription factor 7-interacting protein 2 isoform X2 [Betta splendens]XP_029015562.1 activating transcription factor 7-interacting protein 2 isoform X2 [Betta splendens]
MKQLPSRSTSSGSNDKKMIRLSKSEMRAMVEQEIQRTIKENEARLQVLIDTFEQLESGDVYEHSIQKLEARINIVAKKAEAALACIITEKKNPPSSLVNIKNEIERTVPQDKSADSVEKDADLFQMMENTRKSLKKMQSETKAVKAAIAGLGRTEDLPPPVLTPYGSPNFKGHASFIKKEVEATPENANAEEQEQIQEPKAKRVKVECLSTDQSIIPARNTMEVHSYPPLPSIPFPSVLSMEAASYNIPPRPEVQVALIRDPPGLSVLWNLEKADPCAAPMDSYRVYMTAEKVTGTDNFSDWMIVGEVRAIELPIGVMVNKYKSGCKTCVAVVGKDIFNRFGPFSKVVSVVIPK